MNRAVVIGGSGAVGSALVRELLVAGHDVVALLRRPVRALTNLPGSERLHVHVIDMADIEAATDAFGAGCDAAFCTMGIGQPRKVSLEAFRRVDVDYAGAFARGAAAAGVVHISLLSSVGASTSTRNRYLAVKGAAEQAVIAADIRRTSLFRPSLLVTKEIRYGLQDRVSQAVFPLLAPLLPARFHQVRVEDLARAMRLNAEAFGHGGGREATGGVEILYYPDFTRLLRADAP